MQITTSTFQDLNKYRLVWQSPEMSVPEYGTYLFNAPEEAKSAITSLKGLFAGFDIWLEDHDGNKVEIQ